MLPKVLLESLIHLQVEDESLSFNVEGHSKANSDCVLLSLVLLEHNHISLLDCCQWLLLKYISKGELSQQGICACYLDFLSEELGHLLA